MSEKPTREQILAEPAGQRLDIWTAGQVMGQRWALPCGLDDRNCPGRYRPTVGQWPCLPPYSTDIAAAWKVEEVIASRGLVGAYVQGLADAMGMGGAEWEQGHWRYAHAAPDVRCRAALLAVTPRPELRWLTPSAPGGGE